MNNQPQVEKIVCESCGNEFGCGAKNAECWCFNLAIPQENLAQLHEQFGDCLCRECLQKLTSPDKPKTKNKTN